MRKKTKLLLSAYALCAVTALGCWAAARNAYWGEQRRAAGYVAARAFEETVGAVDGLSEALAKSLYATDGGMCARICGEAYACAGAAQGAMLALPFDTQELEQLSAFLNLAGDYAISLCPTAAERQSCRYSIPSGRSRLRQSSTHSNFSSVRFSAW